jgi:hypothetical protein
MARSVTIPFAALAVAVLALSLLPAESGAVGGSRHPVSAVAQTAPALGGVNVVGLGFGSQPQEADRAIAYARRLGVKFVRTDVPWAVMEPQAPNSISPRALAFTDRLVADATAARIQLVMTVSGSPCWASSAPSAILRDCSQSRQGKANTWPPTAPSDYAAFLAYLATRYGPQLAAIEVWNEPDQSNEDYFGGPNKARRYAAVLRAAYPAVKQANARVPVLAGSLVGSNGVFLRALYAAGIKGYYDGLSVHFYNLTLASMRSIHEVQIANHDGAPLWLDEFGWTSCWPRERIQQEQACVTASTKATNLSNTYRALARTPYVAAAAVYKLQDSSREDFGLLSTGGLSKPAFTAFSRALSDPLGGDGSVALQLRRQGSHVQASGSGPVGDFMELEVFQGPVLRYRAFFIMDRFNRFSLALPSVLGTHGLRVRVFQYWTGPARSAQKSF